MGYKEKMYEALAEMLQSRGVDAVVVTGFEEKECSDGYCETCYHEWVECTISYLDTDGNDHNYNYYGSFGELMRDLTGR